MTNSYYSNEIITCVVLKKILEITHRIEISQALLVAPIIYNDRIVKTLRNKSIKIRSIEELIQKNKKDFCSFNSYYYQYLTNTINSLMLLQQLKLISIENGIIINNQNNNLNKEICDSKRIESLNDTIIFLSTLFKEEKINKLYYLFQIKL